MEPFRRHISPRQVGAVLSLLVAAGEVGLTVYDAFTPQEAEMSVPADFRLADTPARLELAPGTMIQSDATSASSACAQLTQPAEATPVAWRYIGAAKQYLIPLEGLVGQPVAGQDCASGVFVSGQ